MRRILFTMLVVAAVATLKPERMFPTFVMIRGGGLEKPVVLWHSNVRTVTIRGMEMGDLSADPLAIIYQSLTPRNTVPPDAPNVVRRYEVAEFMGSIWSKLAGADGQPTKPLSFGDASHFSTIVVTREGPPVWLDPVVAPGGNTSQPLALSDSAQAILTRLGLRFR